MKRDTLFPSRLTTDYDSELHAVRAYCVCSRPCFEVAASQIQCLSGSHWGHFNGLIREAAQRGAFLRYPMEALVASGSTYMPMP